MKRSWLLLGVLLAVARASGDDTPGFRTTAARSGATAEVVPPKSSPGSVLSLRWTNPLAGRRQIGSPVVAGGRVYVATEGSTLLCLNSNDGSTIWSFSTLGPNLATPAYFKGRIYLASTDGYLYVLHARTGQSLISPILHGTAMVGSPLPVANVSIGGVPTDVVFLTLGDPFYGIRAYNAKTGALIWSGSPGLTSIAWSSPTYHAEYNRIIVGDNSGAWRCYDASTGSMLWEYRPGTNIFYATAACEGEYVAIPSAGGAQRHIHIVKQLAGAPYYQVQSTVLAVPPSVGAEGNVDKVGGTPQGEPQIQMIPALTDQEMHMLRNMPQAKRNEYLDQLGDDYSALKDWFDTVQGYKSANSNKPDTEPTTTIVLSRPVHTSSPAFSGGRIFVSHRELSGVNNDSYFTVAIGVATGAVVWGTSVRPYQFSDQAVVASPAVSNAQWVYDAQGSRLDVRNYSDGVKAGYVEIGEQIFGGPTLGDGRVYITTESGKLLCYDSGNNPPIAPTTFSPAGGANVNWTNSPTLSWGGQLDSETATSSLVMELQVGVGYANQDLELQETAPIQVAGASSYPLGSTAANTHVYWRIRTRDASGARSPWSDIQDFWVQKDLVAPQAPSSIEALPLAGSVQVNWGASPSPDILKYRLYYKTTGQAWSAAAMVDDLTGLTKTVTGLANGTTYDFKVTAVDQGENESAGVTASATPNATISVGGAAYGTVQGAIDAATAGQTVVLGPGTFTGNIVLKAGVFLKGYSAKHTRIVGTGLGAVIQAAGTSEISHLAVTNGQIGIQGGTADLYVHHVAIYAINGHAITADAGGKLKVVNVALMSNVGRGISAATAAEWTTVKNGIIGKNAGGGIQVLSGSGVTYNRAYQNGAEDLDGVAASFTDEAGGDFTESLTSASIDAADPADGWSNEPSPNGGRRNQGAFGDTQWAAISSGPVVSNSGGDSGGGGGGGCGLMGAEILLMLGALRLLNRRSRRRRMSA